MNFSISELSRLETSESTKAQLISIVMKLQYIAERQQEIINTLVSQSTTSVNNNSLFSSDVQETNSQEDISTEMSSNFDELSEFSESSTDCQGKIEKFYRIKEKNGFKTHQ